MFIYYLVDLLFCLSVCGFCLNYYYYLKSLIMVEFIMVSIMLIMIGGIYGVSHYFIYVLILSVCEGALGLLLMVLVSRAWGTDNYSVYDFNF